MTHAEGFPQPIAEGRFARLLRRHLGAHWLVVLSWPDGNRYVLYALWARWWAKEVRDSLRHDQQHNAREPLYDGADLVVLDARDVPAERWGSRGAR